MVIKKTAANKAMVQRPPESRYRLSMFSDPLLTFLLNDAHRCIKNSASCVPTSPELDNMRDIRQIG